ncbi:hypothetical protein EJ02DRAFT_456023 [Clathrospora elynae]|uniref:Inner kinetochore subunit AME1 domain-containing protein n=1 Tax=Clathrospora elynae TaxID=706981 RepID=A0A6A5SM29_9PLEO|nr:hypothetical protein EJ02DRAFT_456023 [Clathrospora elynae]
MAPVDRREHRQQRVRGAGPSFVQASFGFDFGALSVRPAKQASLPPQPSSRRTPVQSTPRSINGSAKRHKSAFMQRSSGSKRKSTPKDNTATPQLGKRKRGSAHAQPGSDDGGDGDEDELSPNREELARSIEKSRRVVGTVSPLREELDDAPDELSMLDEGANTVQKSQLDVSEVMNGTKTPIPDSNGGMSTMSRPSISRRFKSTDPGPATPSLLPNGQPRTSSASRFVPNSATPGPAPVEEGSEDELSPQANGTTPRVVANEQRIQSAVQEEAEMAVDELSSPMQLTPVQDAPSANKVPKQPTSPQPAKRARPRRVVEEDEDEDVTVPAPAPAPVKLAKRAKPRRVVEEDEDDDEDVTIAVPAPAPVKLAKRGGPRKQVTEAEVAPQTTPAVRKPRKRKHQESIAEEDGDQVDELSPATDPTLQQPARAPRWKEDIVEVSSAEEDSDGYEEPEPEPTPRPAAKRSSPNKAQRVKTSSEKPPYKRQKFLGPKHAISVMRIKGSAVRGITVADTTRTILEEIIDHRLNRMAEKLQSSQDSAHRKELRSAINLSLSFKESLNEKLLDLQDANDVLSTNFKKIKLFKHDNAELRKEILGVQNSRQDIVLEFDHVQAEYEAQKAKAEARNTLSDNMFEIEAAIQTGREKARKESREDEGPEMPLSMLLETVGKDVASFGGGLLSNVKSFNGLLERAAGWLEGRA